MHAGRLSDSRRTGNDLEPYGEYEERDMKYDANGNLLSMKRIMSLSDSTRLAFGYSGNRMETVSVGDSLWSYSFDSDGNMVSDGCNSIEIRLFLPYFLYFYRIFQSGTTFYGNDDCRITEITRKRRSYRI